MFWPTSSLPGRRQRARWCHGTARQTRPEAQRPRQRLVSQAIANIMAAPEGLRCLNGSRSARRGSVQDHLELVDGVGRYYVPTPRQFLKPHPLVDETQPWNGAFSSLSRKTTLISVERAERSVPEIGRAHV